MSIQRPAAPWALRGDRTALLAFWVVLGAVVLLHTRSDGQSPAVNAWLTVFVAICVQASPYVTLGVLAAAAVRRVPHRVLTRVATLPPAAGVPTLAICGALVPGCECGSVGVASTMLGRGIRAGPALAFMASAPAINPVVLAATVAAFPGRPGLVAARAGASLLAAVLLGWLWPRVAASVRPVRGHDHDGHGLAADLAHNLGLLVVGAAAAATVVVLVPATVLDTVSAAPVLAVAACALAAVLMSVCSAADAFVAASFTRFPVTAQLAFMVVGPVVDLKLITMYTGTFGRAMAVRFVPLALLATLTGTLAAASVLAATS